MIPSRPGRAPFAVLPALVFVLAIAGVAAAGEDAVDSTIERPIHVGESVVVVELPRDGIDLPRDQLLTWISKCAHAVEHYYGKFPVPRVRLVFSPHSGEAIGPGRSFGEPEPRIEIGIGRAATLDDLARDWELTHEMVHLAFPWMPREHHWIEEGIATYVEPLGRLQTGQLTEESVWHDLVTGLPKGLPAEGDQGLDRTHTWGRTYWGGALYCLLADIEIRKQTNGKFGLRDGLRAINAAGGSIAVHWTLERALETADRATGVPVLTNLWRKMRHEPMPVDLEALWKRLGVVRDGDHLRFDDTAPDAKIRHEIDGVEPDHDSAAASTNRNE